VLYPYSARQIQHTIVYPQRATWRTQDGGEKFWPGQGQSRVEAREVPLGNSILVDDEVTARSGTV